MNKELSPPFAPAQDSDARAPEGDARARASLVVVGTGILWGAQTTLSAEQALRTADRVLFAVADGWTARWIRRLNPNAESLPYPTDGRPRGQIYQDMVRRILAGLQQGEHVCAAFYGSPSVLAQPAHGAVSAAREAGFEARMLPGVSALDCLYADLGVDPGQFGCAAYEAEDFLVRPRTFDAYAGLVLCQIALIGTRGVFESEPAARVHNSLILLAEQLQKVYPSTHEAVLYEASSHPLRPPRIERIALSALPEARVREVTTLYLPPLGRAAVDNALKNRLAAAASAEVSSSLLSQGAPMSLFPSSSRPAERDESNTPAQDEAAAQKPVEPTAQKLDDDSPLKKIDDLDNQIAKSERGSRGFGRLHAQRGQLKAEFGAVTEALKDLLRAYIAHAGESDGNVNSVAELRSKQQAIEATERASSVPSSVRARLAETARRYAGEVLINFDRSFPGGSSLSIGDAAAAVADYLAWSITLFDRVLTDSELAALPDTRAWVLAHRGAARTTLLWLTLAAGGQDGKAFDKAGEDFDEAARLSSKRPYEWNSAFHAVFLTLRRDLDGALDKLKQMRDETKQASVLSSRAMVESYISVSKEVSPEAQRQAARASINTALLSTRADAERTFAYYTAAVSRWRLATLSEDAEDQKRQFDNLWPAIDAARLAAQSAASQACISLVGLYVIQALEFGRRGMDDERDKKLDLAARTLDNFLASGGQIDLEAWAMVSNDPVWTVIKQLTSDDNADRSSNYIRTCYMIKERFANFAALDSRFAAQ